MARYDELVRERRELVSRKLDIGLSHKETERLLRISGEIRFMDKGVIARVEEGAGNDLDLWRGLISNLFKQE